jgi:hypothetical protein
VARRSSLRFAYRATAAVMVSLTVVIVRTPPLLLMMKV